MQKEIDYRTILIYLLHINAYFYKIDYILNEFL